MRSTKQSFATIVPYTSQFNKHEIIRSRSCLYLLTKTVVVIAYCVLGAYTFSWSESVKERALESQLKEERKRLLVTNPCVSEEVLDSFVQLIMTSRSMGVLATNNASHPRDWSFGASCFFTTGLLSSIGYGNAVPLTRTGKAFCVAYLLFGVPLMVGFLSASVSRLADLSNGLLTCLQRRLRWCSLRTLRSSYSLLATSAFVAGFILIPAAGFAILEPSWGYFESVYYCFISLSTIGLGDFVPGDHLGQKYRDTYKIVTAIYLLIGVIFFMLLLAIFNEKPEFEFKEVESEKVYTVKSRN